MPKEDDAFLTQKQSEQVFLSGLDAIDKQKAQPEGQHMGEQDKNEQPPSQEDLTRISLDVIANVVENRNKEYKLLDWEKYPRKGNFYHWFKMHESIAHVSEMANVTFGHTEVIPPGNIFECNHITDEWFKWFLSTPRTRNPYSNPGGGNRDENGQYGSENVFLMQKRNTSVYFTTAAPFQEPDEKSITLTVEAPLLVPAYNVSASVVQFPSLDSNDPHTRERNLLSEIISDLLGIKPDSVNATLDGQTIEPCPVIRRQPLLIQGLPEDNVFGLPKSRLAENGSTLQLFHGGFWMLIRPERLKTGDHLLKWQIESVNYKMNVQLRINSLV